ncbi:tRNA (adenosine(37)-N6)-threonylcarbamoyltransferase complex transferase subunit TsaD [Aliarcobacter skirrowii]|uniref:tRNA (adenosine(37)-N6)-threonylcarbamoyltransferase complex transferase subunit TsaD n=1 Tax=Aliarcobacter skirrowii TaxID=28200 RepID=UPI00299FDDB3|nr:tRNA (adenosine(37)-N6)-threonylcarbamoyltransferase complex transferase subunit TsaD [Aliarcobacter skirrowii]MDX3960444.1 tRNA (adenosine(37)-N6)-threonylcarbamoyltransferase complex transferase subunit TsaD [Aliarcobacter skirrowii]MDX4035591.1 tRNA (adenosine(37)-N6)-threonylcarbamoyltransferase complex transferase subunit TsaD [Aliarcobacter skirrowii]MDX4057472.1 tRNA (adenosine(37)-N6)-threonylcarbamoyltransferase complex transferase subunit TsaD [Aliarcobacter skirrowii]
MILAIESSCDDSSISITKIDTLELVFHKKISQELQHSIYGGVVPELAARLHIEALPKILEECKEYFKDLKAVAVTNAPGLSVTLTEGVAMAKAISIALNIPIIAVNHLKGHIYSLFIEKDAIFPITVLLVSGGHTQIVEANSLTQMSVLARTLDDSFGESFDKVSKMLNLGYPGGPIVQEYSLKGDMNRFDFPIPLSQSPKIEFSYSGLKNAVRLQIESLERTTLTQQDKYDISASFQKAAVEHIMQKLRKLFKQKSIKNFAIVGGASANLFLRSEIEKLCEKYNTNLYLSPLKYCSDNAAMIGRVAVEQFKQQDFTSIDNLDVQTRVKEY